MNTTEWNIIDRFKEPSSYSALAVPLTALGLNLSPGVLQVISLMGSGLCVLLGIVLKEGASE